MPTDNLFQKYYVCMINLVQQFSSLFAEGSFFSGEPSFFRGFFFCFRPIWIENRKREFAPQNKETHGTQFFTGKIDFVQKKGML